MYASITPRKFSNFGSSRQLMMDTRTWNTSPECWNSIFKCLKLTVTLHLIWYFQSNIIQFYNKSMWKYPSDIRRRDLNSQLSDYESTLLTTRPWLLSNLIWSCTLNPSVRGKYFLTDYFIYIRTTRAGVLRKELPINQDATIVNSNKYMTSVKIIPLENFQS